jgi:hypothetical protein
MLIQYVALTSETDKLGFDELARVASALQKQATRDFQPIWGVPAVVSAFATLEDVPIGYWPVIVKTDVGIAGVAGIHLDSEGQPYSLVELSNQWSLTASHECLEMLADPFGNRLVAGDSIKKGQGRVEYLVEVSDPSEAAEFAYKVNDVLVSDFYTPRYFDPVTSPGVQYSFTGAIREPRQILRDGYLSWHNPVDNHWWQAQYFGPKLQIVDLGILPADAKSLRAEIDKRSFRSKTVEDLPSTSKLVAAAKVARAAAAPARVSKATAWRADIAALREFKR